MNESNIQHLMDQAAEAGDLEMAALCWIALNGVPTPDVLDLLGDLAPTLTACVADGVTREAALADCASVLRDMDFNLRMGLD